jgi:hypothetical protein
MIELLAIEAKYRVLSKRLDEASLRMWAAVEARGLGWGGVSAVGKAAGLSRTTILAGLAELKEEERAKEEATGAVEKGGVRLRIRAEGGGGRSWRRKTPNC